MNEKQIELLKNEIEFLEMKIKESEELSDSLYRNGFEDLRNIFKSSYDLKKENEKLKKRLEIYEILTERGIDTNKRYYLFDDIYLSISDLRPYFYIEDGQWIYDSYINSWSGMNEWITDLIDQEYSLFSGNSPYCHAFGTISIKEMFDYIEDKETENYKKALVIEHLIELTKEDGNFKNIHDIVVKAIKFKLDMMKDSVEKDFEY